MLVSIMRFIDRREELHRLDAVSRRRGGLAVLYGRRRLGKTRLLLEWVRKHDGLYAVADQSSADVQRRYFAQAVAQRLPGFADVDYRDWRTLLARLAQDARRAKWRGPVVFDEFPYLVLASSDLPSVLQQWMDHDARDAGLSVAVAGSSQRMMQGLVLSQDAPLYGRAHELLEIRPIAPTYLRRVFPKMSPTALVESYACWGGVPRYWELAVEVSGTVRARVDRLILEPLGPLHAEPDRLLTEELPPAVELRPILDAIGMGVHRVSEIAGRIGQKATSLSRPLDRLVSMGLVRREVCFGESEKKSRRAIYRIDDLHRYWNGLLGSSWEELCRKRVASLSPSAALARHGPWNPASRWWHGSAPEWDIVSESLDGRRLLLGEARWSARPWQAAELKREAQRLASRPAPTLTAKYDGREVVRALFVPELTERRPSRVGDVRIVTCSQLLR
jgi:AAA+ ATPase superfamily predicted ATPase